MEQYISKSTLVAEIEGKIKEWRLGSSSEAKFRIEVYKELSEWLNALEVKEVETWHLQEKERNKQMVDKCDGCNNIKGCIACEDGSEWAHYEEPVNNDYSALLPCIYNRTLEERVKCCKYCSAACEGRVKEPVSEDLEEAAEEYANSIAQHENNKLYSIDDFKAGAKWQKERVIDKACVWLSNVCIEDMTYKYDDFDTSEGWYKFIEDFKKHMEK